MLNDNIITKRDYVFINFNKDSSDVNYLTEEKPVDSYLKTVGRSHEISVYLNTKSVFVNFYEKFKELMNRYLISYDFSFLKCAFENIFQYLQETGKLRDFIRFCKDQNVKYFYHHYVGIRDNKQLLYNPNCSGPYKLVFLIDNLNYTIFSMISKNTKEIYNILILFKNNPIKDSYIYKEFFSLNRYFNKHSLPRTRKLNQVNLSGDLQKELKETLHILGYDVDVATDGTVKMNYTFNYKKLSPITKGSVSTSSQGRNFTYFFKPYISHIQILYEKKSCIDKRHYRIYT